MLHDVQERLNQQLMGPKYHEELEAAARLLDKHCPDAEMVPVGLLRVAEVLHMVLAEKDAVIAKKIAGSERRKFAAMAMAGYNADRTVNDADAADRASWAVEDADALLAELAKEPTP